VTHDRLLPIHCCLDCSRCACFDPAECGHPLRRGRRIPDINTIPAWCPLEPVAMHRALMAGIEILLRWVR